MNGVRFRIGTCLHVLWRAGMLAARRRAASRGAAMFEFLADLKRRKLVQWALAYLAAAWAVLQALGLTAESYGWPHWVMQVAFAATALGFLIALLLAWYHGEQGRQRVSGAELLLIALVLAVGGGLLWRFAWACVGMDARCRRRCNGELDSCD